ncbi:hypothetical protein SDC9_116616 [bioreactor metagenome]|uniref:Uncharacterized protein n=1 Tax=bioreactor metagenome TaxID=1076179 RepID=A0A645BX34_9ZZZZ
MAAGLIAGATVSAIVNSMEPKTMKMAKRNVGHVIKSMGNIIDKIST